MDKETFDKELRETAVYAIRYASDFYGAKGKETYNKLYQVKPKDFINKCYEGFKLGQDKIVANLLVIEDELKSKKSYLKEAQKGKHKRDIYKDPECHKLENEISELEMQRKAFHDIAGVIVWTIFLQERTDIKSFVRNDGGSGYLRDRNIDSVIEVAKKLNEDPNKFTLINDITPSLHVGDLVTVGGGSIVISEVKEETDISNLVSKIVHGTLDGEEVDIEAMKELHKKSPKHGFRQLKRYMDQIISFMHLKKYLETEEGYDPNFKNDKKAVTIWTYDKTYDDFIDFALDQMSKGEEDFVHIPFDCCVVGMFKESYGSEFVQRMDFKHYLYHESVIPSDQCEYLTTGLKFTKENPPELFKYQKMFTIYDLRQKMVSTVTPLFSTLKEKHVLDLLTRKISVYIYFDPDRFFAMCEERGLKPKWLLDKDMKGTPKEYLPSFDGRYLRIGEEENNFIFGYGLFFKIIFDFQFGYNLIDQMKEDLWRRSHPKLGKIRHFIYLRKKRLMIFSYYHGRRLLGKIGIKLHGKKTTNKN